MNLGTHSGEVNYEPSRMDPKPQPQAARYSELPLTGTTQQQKIYKEQNFKQAGDLFRSFSKKEQTDLINTLGGALSGAEDEAKHIMLSFFYKADADYGKGLSKVAKADLSRVQALAAKLQD